MDTIAGAFRRTLHAVASVNAVVYAPERRLCSALPAPYERAMHLRHRFTASPSSSRLYVYAPAQHTRVYIYPHTYELDRIVYSE